MARVIESDSVRVLLKFPEIPVGGRLKFFHKNWEKITQDKWVLSVIQYGYKLEFNKIPPFNGIKETQANAKNQEIISEEVNSLLRKRVIVPVQKKQIKEGFYSTIFLVKKKNGGLRPVINLRPLNQYLKKIHFKMDTLKTVLGLVKKGDYAISLDMKDAYFHLPVHQSHQKYLRFCFMGQVYQFTALCFGPTSAPRVFTKIVAVVAAYLRTFAIRIATYLDDWLALNQTLQGLLLNRQRVLDTMVDLGFMINLTKSNLVPTQTIVYIGAFLHLRKGLVFPTQERVLAIKAAICRIQNGHNTAQDYLHLLGLIASCLQLIAYAKLFMRPIQLHLLKHWRANSDSLGKLIPSSLSVLGHMNWWLHKANILIGKSFKPVKNSFTLTTDASLRGWGAHLNGQIVQGTWNNSQNSLHINCLELLAVHYALKHFLPQLKQENVQIRCDNTTVVQFINRQGGTKSHQLCSLTWDLWQTAIRNNIHLSAVHIAGHKNILADHLSRFKVKETEWSLDSLVTREIFTRWGEPIIDLLQLMQTGKQWSSAPGHPTHRHMR